MMRPHTQIRLMAVLWAVLAGCGTVDFEQSTTPVSRAQALYDERPPPNGANGTLPSCFWAHGSQQALRTLGTAALDQSGGLLASIPLSQVSQDCRQVLRSAVQCALTPAQSVSDPVTGELYQGWWGLAPSWRDEALNVDGRRYVTGCMVQRLNYTGASVPILLEGPHPAIVRSTTYGPQYPLQESTVFGDLFSSTNPLFELLPAFQAYVCWEGLLPQSGDPLELPLLFEERICDNAPLCGLMTLGPCALWGVPNGPYWQFKPNLLTPAWTQTVRVRLETTATQ
jgi:hypothetical protein